MRWECKKCGSKEDPQVYWEGQEVQDYWCRNCGGDVAWLGTQEEKDARWDALWYKEEASDG